MNRIVWVYRFTYKLNNKPQEEFYTTEAEAEFYLAEKKAAGLSIITDFSDVEAVIVWNNVQADEPVNAD